MANWKFKLHTTFYTLKYALQCIKILSKGQNPTYDVLQLAHRLEKGLTNSNPKPHWGWEKAERLGRILEQNPSIISAPTGYAVLNSYLKHKLDNGEISEAEEFKKKHKILENDIPGGVYHLSKEDFTCKNLSVVEHLFYSRHSIRNFSKVDVPKEQINAAVELAMRCPSACNRQPFKVYVVSGKKKESELPNAGNIYNGNQYIFVTGVIDAFNLDEMLDWLISPSIFVGYLTLSLHAFGIGSCVIRKDLYGKSDYNDAIKRICNIPDNEQLILELACGYYPEDSLLAYSNRLSANDIVSFID